MTDHITTSVSAFCQVFLLALQTRNIVDERYLLIFATSILISASWLFNVRTANKSRMCQVAYAIGGGVGAVASIPVYRWIS